MPVTVLVKVKGVGVRRSVISCWGSELAMIPEGEEGIGGGYHWCGGESTCVDEDGEGQEGKRNYMKRVHCERCPRERENEDSGDTEEWRELRW